MEKIKKLFLMLISLPKTLYFNFRAFPFRMAIRCPVLIAYNVKVRGVKRNRVELVGWKEKHYRVYFGFTGSELISPNRTSLFKIIDGKVIFQGEAHFGRGNNILVDGGGCLTFGDDFTANRNCLFECCKEITFGKSVMIGWNINIRDVDGAEHRVIQNGIAKENKKAIYIGNHVWIGAHSDIMKGVTIQDDSIVGWKSVVLKPFEEPNILIAGIPAKKIAEGITWER